MDFQTISFTDEARPTLDGPDGRAKAWNSLGAPTLHRFRRQQGSGGVMFWAGILGNKLVGLFRVPEGVNLTSQSYTAFLNEHLTPWIDDLPLARLFNLIFMRRELSLDPAASLEIFL